MSCEDFSAWMTAMGEGRPLSDAEAANLLGITLESVTDYRTKTEAPLSTALACSALAWGLPPYVRVGRQAAV